MNNLEVLGRCGADFGDISHEVYDLGRNRVDRTRDV
jgi:hypothetical protein